MPESLNENLINELAANGTAGDTFRRLTPDKKSRVYRTALKLFAEFGYDGLSVDQFCREAGISKGSFFQYFPSKSHLLEFTVLMFDDYLGRWMQSLRQAETAALARDRIRYLCNALIVNSRLYRDEEQFYLFVTRALYHSAVALEGVDIERHFSDYVNDIIIRGEQTGEIRSDADAELTAHLVELVVSALVKRRYIDHSIRPRQMADYLISFLFDGIKA
ncbi:MAG TPA: TetR/AcrR family transcriptional regulator [candidate division Zixibacteria bacterium]|nr:TetR/AcrR family transcriptional regulator [candidate division Zixibacteria bacterium]